MLGPIYPVAYWLLAASAALGTELPALRRGPTGTRVVWDLPRDALARRSDAA